MKTVNKNLNRIKKVSNEMNNIKTKNFLNFLVIFGIMGIILMSGCIEEEKPGSCTINNPSGCNLSCEADLDCKRTCCGCINENENCVTELDGMSVQCALVPGECRCVNKKCEFFEEKLKDDTPENQTKITEEQAIATARATDEVQRFLELYPDAELKTLQSCCASGKVLHPDMMCKCAANSKSDWLIEYLAGDEGDYYASVRIAVDEYSGEIIARYPEIGYLNNAAYCEKNEDCFCLPCSGRAELCGCANFIHRDKEAFAGWRRCESCECQNNTCTLTEPEKQLAGNETNVVEANNQFAFDLYNKFRGDEGNIFFSPYSISTALAMTYEGARGKTAKEMRSVLHFPEDDSKRRTEFAGIYNQLNEPGKAYELRTANALWAQEGYKFLDEYFNTVEQYYSGRVTNLDFIDAVERENSRVTINNWVENRTNNKIKDLIPPGVLDEMTRLVLTNAIYFKGKWVKQFDKEDTREADFRVSPKRVVKVQMMSLTGEEVKFNYAEADDMQILEMPYEGEELSMLILLPRDNDLESLEASLNLGKLYEWRNNMIEQEVDVYIPRFTFETKYFMTDTLKEMGMPAAFSMNADFSGMDGTDRLYISDVIHQAFVEVNEEGTEAAASTAVVIAEKGMSTTFRADHPFIFIIQDKGTGSILFMGRVVDPGNE